MKYISNAKKGTPVESGTIYKGQMAILDICVYKINGCGNT